MCVSNGEPSESANFRPALTTTDTGGIVMATDTYKADSAYEYRISAETRALLCEIGRACEQSKLKPTTFGRIAMGDPCFVFDMRRGRNPRAQTVEKLRRFLERLEAANV